MAKKPNFVLRRGGWKAADIRITITVDEDEWLMICAIAEEEGVSPRELLQQWAVDWKFNLSEKYRAFLEEKASVEPMTKAKGEQ